MKTASQLAVLVLATFNLSAATLYVSLESTNPVPPFATWATAATNIQDAVDTARAGDTVLVTNGVYAVGSREVSNGPSRVAVTNAIKLESVNGPLVTTVVGRTVLTNEFGEEVGSEGGGCVYLGSDAVLSGFTLTNGYSGVVCEPSGVVTNCTLIGNSGSGASGGTLYNCTLADNHGNAVMGLVWGGGATRSTLYNCTLTRNWAKYGGGAVGSTLYNCTLTSNWIPGTMYSGGGAVFESILYNCTLMGNWSGSSGGGALSSTLYNCTVTGNFAYCGCGGVGDSTLYNCLVTGNSGGSDGTFFNCTVIENQGGISGTAFNSVIYYNSGGNYGEGTTLNYCCTTPLPTNGVGDITGPPLFVNMGAGDYRLWESSPCIDAGTNLMGFTMTTTNADTGEVTVLAYAHDPTDMLGNTRFIDGNFDGRVAWDIGAYEFNSFRPPRFSMAPQLTPDGWKLNITGAPNKWVHVQRSSDLKNWEDVWLMFPQPNRVFD